MGRTIPRAVAAGICLLAAGWAGAQDLRLERIVVAASRLAEPALVAPGHVTVIDRQQIEASGAADLAEALRAAAGVHIADYGPPGAVKSLSLRGSSGAQVLVLVNGLRLNDSRQGAVDLSQIPLSGIERVEIVRGGQSALFGADALAGIVNIITRRGGESGLRLSVENSSYLPRDAVAVSEGPTEETVAGRWQDLFDGQRVELELTRRLADSDLVISGSLRRAANGFTWEDEQYIGDVRRRINADLLAGDASASLTVPLGLSSLGIVAGGSYSDVGVPGSIYTGAFNSISSDARQSTQTGYGQLLFDAADLLAGRLALDLKGSYRYNRLVYDDPPSAPAEHSLHTALLDLTQSLSVSEALAVVFGANLSADWLDSTQVGQRRRLAAGAFAELPLELPGGLSLVPAVRYDWFSDFSASWSYKLAAIWAPVDFLALKASGSTSYRAPTLNDLYWPNDGFSEGNPDLKPETGYAADLGVSLSTAGLELSVFGFARLVEQGISWAETSPFFWQPVNIARQFLPGAELDLSLPLPAGLRLRGAYALVYSYLLEGSSGTYTVADDRRVPYTPVHSASAAIEFAARRLRASVGAEYGSGAFTDEANSSRVEPHLVLDARVRYSLSEALAVSLSVDNLLNSVYEVLPDYVAPPLSLRLGVEAKL